jgi:cytochrome c-type biogenesis protein CcmH/NrfG
MYSHSITPATFVATLLLGSAMATELPKVTNDAEQNAAYARGSDLISPHVKRLEREPRVTEKARSDLSEGISYLKAVTDYNGRNWAAFWVMGKAYQALGNNMAANGSFRSSYKIQTENSDVAREYALSCLEIGLGDEAIQATKKAISLHILLQTKIGRRFAP